MKRIKNLLLLKRVANCFNVNAYLSALAMAFVFQQIIDSSIEKYKLSGIYAYHDNVTVVGTDQADYDRHLEEFLRAAKAEKLTLAKCKTNKTEIDLLGYRVSHNLIRPDPKRLKPLLNLPVPQS